MQELNREGHPRFAVDISWLGLDEYRARGCNIQCGGCLNFRPKKRPRFTCFWSATEHHLPTESLSNLIETSQFSCQIFSLSTAANHIKKALSTPKL
uniref:Uncharacterized protein n=1 Tax=Romanomermis culicivorax TaxID=13658 RepID=A0A915JES3_ROMCU